MTDTNLSKIWELGVGVQVSTKEAVDCAINIAEAALRSYKVKGVEDLSPKRRAKLFADVDRTLMALGIKDIAEDWWEYHDWRELDAV